MISMYKLTLLLLCLAFLAAAGGAVGLGMALGVLGFGMGLLTLVLSAWTVLSHR
jgi:hypothetical protein